MTDTNTPALRRQYGFMWGYHDGAAHQKQGKGPEWVAERHFCISYVDGYKAGQRDVREGTYREAAGPAFAEYTRQCRHCARK